MTGAGPIMRLPGSGNAGQDLVAETGKRRLDDAEIASTASRPRICDGPGSALPSTEAQLKLPQLVAEKLCAYLKSLPDSEAPVVRLNSPDALRDAFREAGIALELDDGLNLGEGDGLQARAMGADALAKAVDLVLSYSVRTGGPLFFNQLYARADPVAVAAEWVTAAANTNVFTYEVAPVFTQVEVEVLRKVAGLLGGAFKLAHDGLFVPGGSISNLYALHLAHHTADPELATRGAAGGPRCVAFTSDQSHYSFLKAARLAGFGSDNMVMVRSDDQGRMVPEALEDAILAAKEKGYKPIFVGSTAGTTVLGAYDPISQISDICEKHGLWHHVDGCWGGAVVLSEKHRYLIAGAERADSFAWNPHKMSSAGLQCSIFLTRHAGILQKVNGSKAAYLFQEDKLNTCADLGDKTIQCGRKADAFKLWLLWKSKGDAGMALTVDRCFSLAAFMAEWLRNEGQKTGGWELVFEPSCSNVCFWYVPKCLRPFSWKTATKNQLDALHRVAPRIKNIMQHRGDAMIGFQAVNERPNFFRHVFASADIVGEQDIVAMLERMAAIGEELTEIRAAL